MSSQNTGSCPNQGSDPIGQAGNDIFNNKELVIPDDVPSGDCLTVTVQILSSADSTVIDQASVSIDNV